MAAISRSQNITCLLQERARGGPASFANFKTDRMVQNLKRSTSSVTTFKPSDPNKELDYALVGFDIENEFVATIARNNILKVWDVEKKICCWSFNSLTEQENIEWEKIKIVEKHIVCSGKNFASSARFTIRVFNLRTGTQTASITNSRLATDTMWTVDGRLFCYLKKDEKHEI